MTGEALPSVRAVLVAFAVALLIVPGAALAHPGHDTPMVPQPAPMSQPTAPSDGGPSTIVVLAALVGLVGIGGSLASLKYMQIYKQRVERERQRVPGAATA